MLRWFRAVMRRLNRRGWPSSPLPADDIAPRFTAPLQRRALQVLVAEDNGTNRAVLRAMLIKLGHRVDVVENGLEAVVAVSERPYDIVLMDVMMPEMDGIAATREIRDLPGAAARIPIVAVTADVSLDHHTEYRAAGMRSVMTKPVRLQSLISILSEVEGQAGQDAGRGTSAR
jgi:CheY-like chemotaxis protein